MQRLQVSQEVFLKVQRNTVVEVDAIAPGRLEIKNGSFVVFYVYDHDKDLDITSPHLLVVRMLMFHCAKLGHTGKYIWSATCYEVNKS